MSDSLKRQPPSHPSARSGDELVELCYKLSDAIVDGETDNPVEANAQLHWVMGQLKTRGANEAGAPNADLSPAMGAVKSELQGEDGDTSDWLCDVLLDLANYAEAHDLPISHRAILGAFKKVRIELDCRAIPTR